MHGSQKLLAIILAAAAMTTAARADVKAGVDAWGRGRYQDAVDQWRPLAIAGDPDAQFNLGQAYKLGRGVPIDIQIAAEWYRKAAVQGHVQASDNYGLALFQNGRHADAVTWLEASVARGEPRAQLVLGTMLFNGDSVAKDWVRAYALLTRSTAAGITQGAQKLAEMDRYITLDVRQGGIALARQYEAAVPSAEFAATPIAVTAVASRAPPKPRPVAAVKTLPVAAALSSAPASVAWRVQFGAFRDEGNAKRLWQELRGRVASLGPLRPIYARTGSLTKLQTGGPGSAAIAAKLCGDVKTALPQTPCVVVAP